MRNWIFQLVSFKNEEDYNKIKSKGIGQRSRLEWSDEECAVYFETVYSPALEDMKQVAYENNIPLIIQWCEEQLSHYGGEYIVNDKGIVTDKVEHEAGSFNLFRLVVNVFDGNQLYIRWNDNKGFVFPWTDVEDKEYNNPKLDSLFNNAPYKEVDQTELYNKFKSSR